MGMTIIEKILSLHSQQNMLKPGDFADIHIDARVARDFGGANVVNNIEQHGLGIDDPSRTFFTFDCNPTGSDQAYAANQHICRVFARENGIKVYDINKGIGTHILIEEGLAFPGSTAVSTDSHANILGAIGAFGQGMGDRDIAAAWSRGSIWFKVPPSVRLVINGRFSNDISAKDIALNLLARYGPDQLLGYAVEIYGDATEDLSLDDRVTISSMATEMGAIILFFPPNREVMRYCNSRTGKPVEPVFSDRDATYEMEEVIDAASFIPRISKPGQPASAVKTNEVRKIKIDSVFIGSCTNGRITDMRAAAEVLKGKKVAPGVVLKIVPSTDLVWQRCLEEGLINIFKEAGAMVSNAGCGGCAAGQVGQNGPGEVTVSTGNRNFPGKQGRGDVYLASPAIAAASAIAGYITTPENIPDKPAIFPKKPVADKPAPTKGKDSRSEKTGGKDRPVRLSGRALNVRKDHIDTDMIFHNRYLSITDPDQMGKHTFAHMDGYSNFATRVKPGDILFSGKNFGAGSSRQQAVDCFISLGVQAIVAESFGSIYERNAINAGFPVLVAQEISDLKISDGDEVSIDLESGEIQNHTKKTHSRAVKFSDVQMQIYRNGGLL